MIGGLIGAAGGVLDRAGQADADRGELGDVAPLLGEQRRGPPPRPSRARLRARRRRRAARSTLGEHPCRQVGEGGASRGSRRCRRRRRPGPRGLRANSEGGRPPVETPPPNGATRPSRISTSMRAAIVDRASPVVSASSARVRGRRRAGARRRRRSARDGVNHARLSHVQQATFACHSTKVRDACHSDAVHESRRLAAAPDRPASRCCAPGAHEALRRQHGARRRRPRPARRPGPRPGRGERRRQVDADEDPRRRPPARRRHDRDRRRGASASATRSRRSRPGVSTVFQEFNLLPERTVAENIYLGREPRRRGLVDTARMHRDTEELLDGLGVDRPPTRAAGARPLRRRAADRRDRQGGQLRRPDHLDGRADRGARRPRGRAALRDHRAAHRRAASRSSTSPTGSRRSSTSATPSPSSRTAAWSPPGRPTSSTTPSSCG